ncbi:MCP four helix bundle domain-containing protein, partial [Brucella gallinifaecis]
ANIERITKVWGDYLTTYFTPEEKALAESFSSKRKNYADNAVKPALALLGERKFDEANLLLAGKAGEFFAAAKQDLDKLV